MAVRRVCDRCGKPHPEASQLTTVEMRSVTGDGNELVASREICEKCTKAFREFFNGDAREPMTPYERFLLDTHPYRGTPWAP